jgi:hypothetical protein
MGIAHCCFTREKEAQNDYRSKMVIEYIEHLKVESNEKSPLSEFPEVAIIESPNLHAESLDDCISQASR